jgi:hypothetical protein
MVNNKVFIAEVQAEVRLILKEATGNISHVDLLAALNAAHSSIAVATKRRQPQR